MAVPSYAKPKKAIKKKAPSRPNTLGVARAAYRPRSLKTLGVSAPKANSSYRVFSPLNDAGTKDKARRWKESIKSPIMGGSLYTSGGGMSLAANKRK